MRCQDSTPKVTDSTSYVGGKLALAVHMNYVGTWSPIAGLLTPQGSSGLSIDRIVAGVCVEIAIDLPSTVSLNE